MGGLTLSKIGVVLSYLANLAATRWEGNLFALPVSGSHDPQKSERGKTCRRTGVQPVDLRK